MQKDNMTKKNGKLHSIHEKAIRLLEGGIVEIDGHCFSMTEIEGDDISCKECQLDSICSRNVIDVCVEADMITQTRHIMILR